MRKSTALLAMLPATLVISMWAGGGSAAERSQSPQAAGFRLRLFDSCDGLVTYAREHTAALISGSGVLPHPPLPARATQFDSSRRSGVDYSTTNVQEEGIDEPDVVKTNGLHLFAVVDNRIHAVAVRGRPRVVDSLELPAGRHELLLRGGRLLVLSHDGAVRLIVLSSMPRGLSLPNGRVEENLSLVRTAPLAHWLPRYELRRRGTTGVKRRYLVQCRHVWRPRSFSGLGLLTVLTIDLDKSLEPVNTVSLLSDGEIVYASSSSLYVAAERWADRPEDSRGPASEGAKTAIHKFGISSPLRTRYRASGFVPGFLLSQWSLSEHDEVLRVASTDTPVEQDAQQTDSGVSTLAERDGRLVHLARIGGLGRGERLFAVRFIGEVGYVVTFRQVDPLYTLDLSNPDHPKLLSELKIPGWSSYLHPIGDDLLLGIGQDADDRGVRRGLHLSLFDVSNLRRPLRLHQRFVGRGYSHAEYDHHAFLYWPPARLAVMPISAYDGATSFAGALGVRVGRGGIEEVGRVNHPRSFGVLRAVVVGDSLYTVSHTGVDERGVRAFERRGWVEFPSE